jgi:Zinc knuckle
MHRQTDDPSLDVQRCGRGVGGVPALRAVQLPGRPRRLGAGRGRLHHALLRSRPGARCLLCVRPAGAPVLRVDALSHIQVPRSPPSLASADTAIPCGCAVGCEDAVSRIPASAAHIRRHVITMMIHMFAPMLRRPSCYYCGEGGHTAAECNREKPIAVRNERQHGYSERNVAASYYGYADDYGGAQGCVAPAA